MNTHFWDKMSADEIWDTLFFTGVEFNRVKHKNNRSNQYVFITPDFDVVVENKKIKIGDKTFKYVGQAKQHIWSIV